MGALGPRLDRSKVEVPLPEPRDARVFDRRVATAITRLREIAEQTGRVIVNFGVPGGSDATVFVPDQAGIVDTSIVWAELCPIATVDHTVDEHLVEPLRVFACRIVPGVGFSIFVRYDGQGDAVIYGQWTVAWRWS